jgi:hypothetical protein
VSTTNPDCDRMLVVANRTCPCPALIAAVAARVRPGHTEVRIVAPALNSRLHHWVSDLDGAIEQARDRLDRAVDALAAHGVDAVGSVGDSDPLVAIDDALRSFAAHEIIIATHPPGQSNWLERNLVERVRERHGLPVTHLTSSYDLQPA